MYHHSTTDLHPVTTHMYVSVHNIPYISRLIFYCIVIMFTFANFLDYDFYRVGRLNK